MIRLIIDKLGSGHHDLFLKIDLMPSFSRTADSYYLFDFLEIDDSEIEKQKVDSDSILAFGAIKLIDFWTERIKSIEKGQVKFIPFDLWDEYIGGLRIEKTKLGYEVKLVSTDKIHGYGVDKSNLDMQIEQNKLTFNEDEKAEWLISEQVLFDGLEWSKNELKK
ncbi:hypothetical protein [Echinicola sp. 20G]|uniref:hypothetical protein n=1 Tax=Echinicola sp. 20G TaxID=2781961 RepID=UPI00190FDADA|nr:hypothetical protein [Echinicola sp. 20G]